MIYLDHNSTTPLDSRVLEAMMPFLTTHHGNPSARHPAGQVVKEAVDKARQRVADLMGCEKREVIFTSGGTESNHLAIQGSLLSGQFKGKHIVIGGAEHSAVTKAAMALTKQGFEVTKTEVTEFGEVTAEAVAKAMRPDTALVSVMHAQNEVGTVNNIEEIAEAIGHRRVLFHTDAAQTIGKVPTTFPFMGVQLLSMAGHKFYGPLGIGALIASSYVKLTPLLQGAGQENGRRAGTTNAPAIVGFAKALELCYGSRLAEFGETVTALRDYMHLCLAENLRGLKLNGHLKYRLPTTLNLSFLGVSGPCLTKELDGIMVSTGAACHDGKTEPSDCFKAMGLGADRAGSALRLSFGRSNTVDEIDIAIQQITDSVLRLRAKAGIKEADLEDSDKPICPRCQANLAVMSTSGGMLMKCVEYGKTCGHLLPLPGTRPPE